MFPVSVSCYPLVSNCIYRCLKLESNYLCVQHPRPIKLILIQMYMLVGLECITFSRKDPIETNCHWEDFISILSQVMTIISCTYAKVNSLNKASAYCGAFSIGGCWNMLNHFHLINLICLYLSLCGHNLLQETVLASLMRSSDYIIACIHIILLASNNCKDCTTSHLLSLHSKCHFQTH